MAKLTVHTPKVHVVLDTNCLFTEAEDRLVSIETATVIESIAKELGLEILWYLPKIVIGERRRQMISRANGLLIPVRKLEKLLGHNLALTQEILADRVEDAIKAQMKKYGLKELVLDYQAVDWAAIEDAAAKRLPPFSDGESEKGFKDALILESFVQLVKASPTSPKSCRLVLLSSDQRLVESASSAAANFANAVVVTSLEELRTVLAAIAAHLTAEDLAKILPKASDLFFTSSENQEALFYKWSIREKISANDTWATGIEEEFKVSRERNLIASAAFEKKEGQRLTFRSIVTLKLKATRRVWKEVPEPTATTGNFLSGLTASSASALAPEIKSPTSLFAGLLGSSGGEFETVTRQGQAKASVEWCATLTRAGNLTKPVFAALEVLPPVWDPQ